MSPEFAVFCVPAVDGVAVEPCGEYQGLALVPQTMPTAGARPLDYSNAGALFAWAFVLVAGAWLTGLVIGAIMRVIRSV